MARAAVVTLTVVGVLLASQVSAGATSYQHGCETYFYQNPNTGGWYQADWLRIAQYSISSGNDWTGYSRTTGGALNDPTDQCYAHYGYAVEASVWLRPYNYGGYFENYCAGYWTGYPPDADGQADANAGCVDDPDWQYVLYTHGHKAWSSGTGDTPRYGSYSLYPY